MCYYDIIDKLSNRVEEGMMTSIQKNTVKAKSVLSALISGDFSSLPKKDIKVLGDTKFFNKSPIKYTTSEKMVEDLYIAGVSNHTVRFVSYIKKWYSLLCVIVYECCDKTYVWTLYYLRMH